MFRLLTIKFLLLSSITAFAQELNYGLFASTNYSMLGSKYGNYTGVGLGNFGLFLTKMITPYHTNSFYDMFDYSLETGISMISTREQNEDTRYSSYNLDATALLLFSPDRNSTDLKIICGLRPSYLLFNSTEVFENGNFVSNNNFSKNKSKNGDIDLGVVLGVNLSAGEIVNVEFKYVFGLTDQTTNSYVKGRPSLMEFTLKLSAIKLRDKVYKTETDLKKRLEKMSRGTLLVMLQTPTKKDLTSLKPEQASEIRREIEFTNSVIIDKFKSDYSFSKVAFFMDSNSYKVMHTIFDSVLFDENKNIISSDQIDTANYFIASICEDVSNITKKIDYGLFAYNKKMVQLDKPFNVAANNLGIFAGGDPINYLRKKRVVFAPEHYSRIIKRFSDRLTKFKVQ